MADYIAAIMFYSVQSKRLEVEIFKTPKAQLARIQNLNKTGIPAQRVHLNKTG